MKQPIKNTYPSDLTVETNMFFVNTNIIEHQHVAGVKSPLLLIIENTKHVQDGKLLNTSTTAHKVFTELQFKKLITSAIEEFQIGLMSITGQKVTVGTVALTLKFQKFFTVVSYSSRKFQWMEQYYAQQAQLSHFSGSARQRGSGFGSLAFGVFRGLCNFEIKRSLRWNLLFSGKTLLSLKDHWDFGTGNFFGKKKDNSKCSRPMCFWCFQSECWPFFMMFDIWKKRAFIRAWHFSYKKRPLKIGSMWQKFDSILFWKITLLDAPLSLLYWRWNASCLQWGQPIRIRHVVSGRYLSAKENTLFLDLCEASAASCPDTLFALYSSKVKFQFFWRSFQNRFSKTKSVPVDVLISSFCLIYA